MGGVTWRKIREKERERQWEQGEKGNDLGFTGLASPGTMHPESGADAPLRAFRDYF